MNNLLKFNKSAYFWTLCLIMGVCTLANKYFLYTEQLFHNSFDEQFTADQIQWILTYQNATWKQIIGYAIIPLIIIIRVLYTSFCLQIGNLVDENRWKFSSLYNISLKADVIFCINALCYFFYYSLSSNYQTIDDLSVNSVSLLKLVGRDSIPDWLILAFNSINLFELAYIILLVLLIKVSFSINYLKSTVFVILTYGIGNYLFLTAMTFWYLSLT